MNNYKYIKNIERPIDPEIFITNQVAAVYSPYTVANQDALNKYSEAEDADKLQKVLSLKIESSNTVENLLGQGMTVVTHIDCYDVCTAIIRTLSSRGNNSTQTEDRVAKSATRQGHAIVLGTPSGFTRSGLSQAFSVIPNCTLVHIDVDKADKPEKEFEEAYAAYSKAIAEKKKAVAEAKNKAKEAGEEYTGEQVEDILPLIKGREYATRIAWKMILGISQSCHIFTESTLKAGTDLRGQIVRDCMVQGIPTFVVEPHHKAKPLDEMINIEKVVASYEFYEGKATFLYDKVLFKAVLSGRNAKENVKDVRFIEDLKESVLNNHKPKDRVEVTGTDIACDPSKAVCILTSVFKGQDVNFSNGITSEMYNYLEQLKGVLDNYFRNDIPVLAVADNAYGVSVLRAAYYYYLERPESNGRMVVYVGDIEDGEESAIYSAFLEALLATGKVKVVTGHFIPRYVTVPNTKEDRKANDPETINRLIKSERICDYIAESAASKLIFINAGLEDSIKCSPTVTYTKGGKDKFSLYNYDAALDFFKTKTVAFSKTEWYKEIPNKIDIKPVLQAIKGQSNSNVNEF